MNCPICDHKQTDVYNSRQTSQAHRVWRRRRCRSCQNAFTTYESIDMGYLTVIKKSGNTEPYSRSKLLISICNSCIGLDDHINIAEALVDTVEKLVINNHQDSINTEDIANIVLSTLKKFHTSAYVRYLSYRGGITNTSHLREIVNTT
ncbi:MAG: ATP cone domain-containing protein [Candidatus Saccharimonadales bacterium]